MSRKILKQRRNTNAPIQVNELPKPTEAQLFEYNTTEFTEYQHLILKDFSGFEGSNTTHYNWLNLHSLQSVIDIERLCDVLSLDRLTKQAIFDINQRPKFQEYDAYCYISIKSVLPTKGQHIALEQISFVLGDNFLISLQEEKADYFEHVRERIRKKEGIVRDRGADYLLFLLLESILDNYFTTISSIDNESENLLSLDVESDFSPVTLHSIENYKRKLQKIKKTILPLKDILNKIEREEVMYIKDSNQKYFYELRDLCLYLLDEADQLNMRLESYTNLFFSIQGHKMNQVMKTLTVVATIFIPLTFVAGVYGMNFRHIPELEFEHGYAMFWGIIGVLGTIMLVYFKRKNWF